jgi:uncharacterized protein YdeI (YjbR/CyaY-like superfamily)
MERSSKIEPERYQPADRAAWRRWLEANHASMPGVSLVYFKQSSGKRSLTYSDAVEEALCFGWIDSRANTLDDERSTLVFSPRNPKSAWSKINKDRVGKLIEEGSMSEAGLKAIEVAKANGAWTALDAIEQLQLPDDLREALAANETAKDNFEAFPPSSKKIILGWIASAKRPETRAKRIEEAVTLAAQNIKANHSRQ